MEVAHIKERIKVRADFAPSGKVTPLLFKRGQMIYRIRRVNSIWEDRQQQGKLLYFSVLTDRSDDVFQLCYRHDDRSWWLELVMMDG